MKSEVIKTSFSGYSEEMTDLIDELTAYTPTAVCAFYRIVQSDDKMSVIKGLSLLLFLKELLTGVSLTPFFLPLRGSLTTAHGSVINSDSKESDPGSASFMVALSRPCTLWLIFNQ